MENLQVILKGRLKYLVSILLFKSLVFGNFNFKFSQYEMQLIEKMPG